MQTKRNLKLHALTSTQTNNQNRNIETTLSLYSDKALLFKVKKLGQGEQKKTISPA